MDKVQIGCEISPINVSQMFNLPMIHILYTREKDFARFLLSGDMFLPRSIRIDKRDDQVF
jgi:hypothetical protein